MRVGAQWIEQQRGSIGRAEPAVGGELRLDRGRLQGLAEHRLDPAREAYVAIRLGALVRDPQPKLEDIIVLALAVATEVTDALDLSEDRESRERMRHLFGRLPEPLWEVVTHTQAAIAHHVMTR